jgi:hypothetical protein
VLEPPALAKAKLAETEAHQWICVKHPDNDGQAWVAAWLMEVAAESPMTLRRKGGGFVNLRSGNMSQLGRAGQIAKGDKVIPLESPTIAFEKIRLSSGTDTPDHLKNWIYIETPFGQRAWVAAWYLTPHPESQTPPAIASTSVDAIPTVVEAQAAATPIINTPTLLKADALVNILSAAVKQFAGDGEQLRFPLLDMIQNTYAVNAIGSDGATVVVLARIVGDKIVIEADANGTLADKLQAQGVDRSQIILAYAGETRP